MTPPSLQPERLLAVRQPHDDGRAPTELRASAPLLLAVDRHGAVGDELLGLGTVLDDAGELQQLAEADDVVAQGDVHASIVVESACIAGGRLAAVAGQQGGAA